MRVLQLIKTTRGATWALRQVQVLVSKGLDVHVALPDMEGIASRYRDAGATVHVIDTDIARLKSPFRLVLAVRAFRRLVRTINPDIIHSHFVGTTLFMRLAMRQGGPPRIFQVPGPLHLERWFTRELEVKSAYQNDNWLASCEHTRRVYESMGLEGRVGLSYYGIDLSSFVSTNPRDLRKEIGLQADESLVGMIAHIYAPKKLLGQSRGLKGHEDLIDAVALLRSRGIKSHLVIVGGAWVGAESYESKLKQYAFAKLGDAVTFLGHSDDVVNIYPALNVAVHPSHSENLGGAVESLALEIPTIATNVGGFPDIVRPHETGWLAPPRQPTLLADAIQDALSDPPTAQRLAAAGGVLVKKMLDVRRNGEDVVGFYDYVLTSARDGVSKGSI